MPTGVVDSSTSILNVLTALPVLSTAADVGSGNGRISNHLRELGWNVSGCEINPELALLAQVDHADARKWRPSTTVSDIRPAAVCGTPPQPG